MRVLIATRRTQGAVAGDYCWALEGELVTPVTASCGSPDSCGCGRGFPGLASSRATTTAMVVERAQLNPDNLRLALRDSLDRGGWLQWSTDLEIDELLDAHVDAIAMVCHHFEAGAVVGRRDDAVFIRALTTV
ncbi:MAG: hypothetical protein JWN99_1574 [Ilumatobacteraceae bacterium]|nr:hypothetical protein [Ilumatobacteraceae bacterium]